MTTSEHTNEIAGALAAAQAKFKPVAKTRTANIESQKGSYSYSYADLSDVIEATREGLSANQLALTQPIAIEGEQLILVTRLLHSSGQWIESVYPIAVGQRAQDTGAAITYARRYCVSALLGVASEDDTDAKDVPAAKPQAKKETGEKATKPQLDKIDIERKKKNVGFEFCDVLIAKKWEGAKLGNLTKKQAGEFIDFLVNSTQEHLDELAVKYITPPIEEPLPEDDVRPLGEPLVEAPA